MFRLEGWIADKTIDIEGGIKSGWGGGNETYQRLCKKEKKWRIDPEGRDMRYGWKGYLAGWRIKIKRMDRNKTKFMRILQKKNKL